MRTDILASTETERELPPPPPGVDGPELLGQVYESLLPDERRRAGGAFYTPRSIADGVVARALSRHPANTNRAQVCDPAVGGGAFLLAAARRLHRAGVRVDQIVRTQLWGVDVDPLAVRVATAALWLWARDHGVDARPEPGRIVEADALLEAPDCWGSSERTPAGFELVVGNPPFQGQLRARTARSSHRTQQLRERFGGAVTSYTDESSLFLLLGTRLLGPRGRLAMLLPHSALAARDGAGVRDEVLRTAFVRHLWISQEREFEAAVQVCAPVLERRERGRRPPSKVTRSSGSRFARVRPSPTTDRQLRSSPTWSRLGSDLLGVPAVELDERRTLADWCRTTAGFRQQFYGLVPHVVEGRGRGHADDRFPRLVTSGLIDPGSCLWGRRPARFARREWDEPRVDLESLATDADLAAWCRARLRPKVVVATQTRVLECAVDEAGCWIPSTPTIAVEARDEDLWLVAAALLAPPVSAWALTRYAGAALAADHLKLAAHQIPEVPLPPDRGAWIEGAALLVRIARDPGSGPDDLIRFGRVMCRAHGSTAEVLQWWAERLPRRSRALCT